MTDSVKHIVTQDCLPFNDSNISADILQTFLESQQDNIFRLSNNVKNDEESLLAEYDYRYKKYNAFHDLLLILQLWLLCVIVCHPACSSQDGP